MARQHVTVFSVYSDTAQLSVSCTNLKTMWVGEVICNLTERCRRASAFYTGVSNRSELVKSSRRKMQQACWQAPDSLGTRRTHKDATSRVCDLFGFVPLMNNHTEDTVTVQVNKSTERCTVGNITGIKCIKIHSLANTSGAVTEIKWKISCA